MTVFVEGRLVEKVTYVGVTFRGARFGLTPGCWLISRADAVKIAKACDRNLPRVGYDISLRTGRLIGGTVGPDFSHFLCHHGANRFRLSVADGYSHEPWKEPCRKTKA